MVLDTCKLISLSVRGINNFRKRRTIFTWCRKQKADLIFSAGNSFKERLWKTMEIWMGRCYDYVTRKSKFVRSCPTFQKRVWLHYFVKIRGPTRELFDPEGGDQDKLNVLINIYAPNNDKDITNFLYYPRTILQNENLEDEENIIIGGKINCPLNSALDKKWWYNVTEEISYRNHWLFTRRTWFGWQLRIKNPSLKSFTRSQNSPMILCRLDYWLILHVNNLQDSVSVTNITPSINTHHAAISLDFNIVKTTLKVRVTGKWSVFF